MKVDYEGSFYIKVGRKYLKTNIDTTYIENLQKQNSELEAQLKHMQNFENCDYQQHIQDCPVFNSDKSMSCKECPYWKLQRPINEFVKQRYDAPEEKFPPVDTSKMTTEERLMNEAEEYFKSVCEDYNEEFERTGKRHYFVGFDIKNAYIASAEPREKQLEEKDKKIAELEQKNTALEKAVIITQQRYFPLQDKFIEAREILEEVLRRFKIYKISDADKKYLERAKQFLEAGK